MVVDVVHQFQPHVVDGGGCFRQQRQRAQQFFGRSTRRTRILVLKISTIEQSVSLDHTRPCIYTYNKKTKIQVSYAFNSQSDPNMNVHRVVLKGTQRVPPTCITKTSRTSSSSSSIALSSSSKSTVEIWTKRSSMWIWSNNGKLPQMSWQDFIRASFLAVSLSSKLWLTNDATFGERAIEGYQHIELY